MTDTRPADGSTPTHGPRAIHEVFADPSTPDAVLDTLPLIDADSYLAAAARPNPSATLAQRIILAAHTKPMWRYRSTDPPISHEDWLIAAFASPAAACGAGDAAHHLAITTLLYCRNPVTVLRAVLTGPGLSDATILALLTIRAGDADDDVKFRAPLLAALDEIQHPASLAWQLGHHHQVSLRTLMAVTVRLRHRPISPAAARVATQLAPTWSGPVKELLNAAEAATDQLGETTDPLLLDEPALAR